MAEHGGYRKPTNPAPVSGPGAHSRRTDGQPTMDLPNAQYGENQSFREIQAGASMPSSATPSGATGSGQAAPTFVGMGAPSQQPDVPVTSGADMGAGPGAEALGIQTPKQADAQYLQQYLPSLVALAEKDDTPPGMKSWVRSIIASL